MDRIAVGLDGSTASATALRWAMRLAGGTGAGIVGLHAFVNPWSEMRPDDFDRLVAEREATIKSDWLEPAIAAGIEVDEMIRAGDPRDVLVEVAAEIDADVLVLGRTGSGTGPGLFHIGSVAEHAVHHTTLPVAVVPAGAPAAFDRIVVGVDGSESSLRALRWAGDVATKLGSEVVVVRAIESAGGSTSDVTEEGLQRAVERELTDLASPLVGAGITVTPIAQRDLHPADALLGVAGGKSADLLVVGLRGLGGFTGLRAGGVALKVLHHAGVPLVLVADDG